MWVSDRSSHRKASFLGLFVETHRRNGPLSTREAAEIVSRQVIPSLRHNPEVAAAELAKMVLGDQPLNQTLQRVVELTKQVVPDVADVSVTMLEREKPRTLVFTGRKALELDRRQCEAGFGPGLDAATMGQTVTISTSGDNPYRKFSRTARRYGITHIVAIPLPVPHRVLGALNLYLPRHQPPSEELVSMAETFATYAAAGVANAVLHQAAIDLSQQLKAALASRSVIEQAKGILMGRNRCSSDAAITQLARAAQHQHLTIWDTAAAIVAEVDADAPPTPK